MDSCIQGHHVLRMFVLQSWVMVKVEAECKILVTSVAIQYSPKMAVCMWGYVLYRAQMLYSLS